MVRHGKSKAMENNERQSQDSPLSMSGRDQASILAKRVAKEKIDIIISSKWDRAYQTAEIISQELKLEFETVEGIHEKEQSPELDGASFESEIHRRYTNAIEKYESNLDWKFEGKGESIRDLIKRAKDFQYHLVKGYANKNVLVVSHGLFIRAFVISALLGPDYDDKTFYKIYTSISINNTGITLLEYIPDRNHWELVCLNDHIHTTYPF